MEVDKINKTNNKMEKQEIMNKYGLPDGIADYLSKVASTGDDAEYAIKELIVRKSCKMYNERVSWLEERALACLDEIWYGNGELENKEGENDKTKT